ncbi:pRL2-8 [Streptomyces sp. SID8379]|uniref:hypothetical protein n=1 Tax=unclassified Streptomyces TaxID=2593676 RepID=UPI00036A8A21|nr:MULTISPECIES: hypothetical protein [unclassified Streptomyces]MYW69083.1 pRL2-8 [Streptomyces sp. SID8379]
MSNRKALNPPVGQCRQCWFHAYASKEAHRGLKPGQDCPQCVSHMGGRCPDNMIVKAA